MNQREEQSNDVLMKIKLEVMTSFIISAREYYLSHVARYLGEQNAEPIAKQDALYSKYILMLYHKVLVVYKDRANQHKISLSFMPTEKKQYDILKYLNASSGLACELIGFPVVSYFDNYFNPAIKREVLTTKKDSFHHACYYSLQDSKETIFKSLTADDLIEIAKDRFKPMPRLSPPIEWLKESDIFKL